MRNEYKQKEFIANIIANWWASTFVNPTMDNGDDSPSGMFGMMLASSMVKPVSTEQLEVFKRHIKKSIIESFDTTSFRTLGADYGPGFRLREAMEKAKIPIDNCPIKTNMNYSINHVEVAYGYSSPYVFLYLSLPHLYKIQADYKDYGETLKKNIEAEDFSTYWTKARYEEAISKNNIKQVYIEAIIAGMLATGSQEMVSETGITLA